MKTNIVIRIKTQGGIPYDLPIGTEIEKNEKSPTGFYINPSSLPKDSIVHHDAIYYGFPVKEEDIDF